MNIVWVHEDAISLDHPAVAAAGKDARAVFIWDAEQMAGRGWTLKRRVFVMECVRDLGIPIYSGDAYDTLRALVGDDTLYAARSPDPYIRDVLADLRDHCDVVVVDAPTLAEVPANTDTGRFFRFWNRAKKSALTHSKDLVEP